MKLVGIALLIVGGIGLAYGGISWTTPEKVVDLGPLQVTHDKTRSLPLTPVAGVVCLIAGGVLLVTAARDRS